MADRNNNLGSSGRSDDSIDNPDLDRGESGGMKGSSSDRDRSESDRDRSETVGDEPDRSRDNDRSGSSGQSGQGGKASRR